MGATFPVIESPQGGKVALKSLIEPFDSHFVVTDKVYGFPSKPGDPPGWDEIVVFSKAQVLPRYVFHFTLSLSIPYSVSGSSPLVLWLSHDISAVARHEVTLKSELPRLSVITATTLDELRVQACRMAKIGVSRLGIVINCDKFGSSIWRLAFETVRGQGFLDVPIITFCPSFSPFELDKLGDRASMFRVPVVGTTEDLVKHLCKI